MKNLMLIDMTDAICGLKVPNQEVCGNLATAGLMRVSLDTHEHLWVRDEVEKLDLNQAFVFYQSMKEAILREEGADKPTIEIIDSDKATSKKIYGG